MFFVVGKVVWFCLTPSNLLLGSTLLCAGACLLRPTRRRAGMALAALALLAAVGFSPAGIWLTAPLENRFPAFDDQGRRIEGIIVLGGAARPETSFGRNQLDLGEAGERLVAMADLGRRHPEARIVFTGGSGSLLLPERSEAEAVRRYGAVLGLDLSRVEFESRSRTTWENAVDTREMAPPVPGQCWLLVTSAWHMPRAVGAFREAGYAPRPYPVDYMTSGAADQAWLPSPKWTAGLDAIDVATREWLGLAGYWLSGRSSSLFPEPSPEPACTAMR